MDYIKREDAINALHEYFAEFCKGKPIEYCYGFFDALAVIRSLTGQPARGASAE